MHPRSWVFRLQLPTRVLACLVDSLAELEHRLASGTSEKLQLGGLCAAFVMAREEVAKAAR